MVFNDTFQVENLAAKEVSKWKEFVTETFLLQEAFLTRIFGQELRGAQRSQGFQWQQVPLHLARWLQVGIFEGQLTQKYEILKQSLHLNMGDGQCAKLESELVSLLIAKFTTPTSTHTMGRLCEC